MEKYFLDGYCAPSIDSSEDPIIMYLIVREELNMSIGKTGAQIGHAVQLLMQLHRQHEKSKSYNLGFFPTTDPVTGIVVDDPIARQQFFLFEEWLNSDKYTKVLLGADDKEWEKLKQMLDKRYHVIVVDAGHTELAPNTETIIGLFPMKKSERPKLVKRLQALK